MDVVGVIPARYFSSRFEAKVLAEVAGKPLLQYVWERAKQARILDELFIACDHELVRKAAEGFGAKVVMTSRDHVCGSDRISEAVAPLEARVVVNIQADEPLVHPTMIEAVAGALLEDDAVNMATVMKKIEDSRLLQDPNVVKVVVDRNNFALYFSRAPIPHLAEGSEIKEPLYYKHIGLYAYTKDFLYTYKHLPAANLERAEKLEQLRVLEAGFKIKVIETRFDSMGVDTPEDLEKVRGFLEEEKL